MSIDYLLSNEAQKRLEKNRKFLTSIIKSLELCARQGARIEMIALKKITNL